MAAFLQPLADVATGVALLTIPVLAVFLAFSRRLKMNGLYWLLVIMLFVVLISFAAVIGSLIPLGLASLPWIIT